MPIKKMPFGKSCADFLLSSSHARNCTAFFPYKSVLIILRCHQFSEGSYSSQNIIYKMVSCLP